MDDFLQDIKSGGVHDSVGAFSVNWTAADRKLADFYQEYPHLWFAKMVQATLALGVHSLHISDSSSLLLFSVSTIEAPPPLEELLRGGGEVSRELSTGIRAAFSSEKTLEEIQLIRLPETGKARRLLLRKTGLEEGFVDSELYRELNSGPGRFGGRFYLRLRWARLSWWSGLRKRLARQASLYKLCSERLAFCPVPISLSGFRFGQGSGRPYSAVAAEYIMGSLSEDTIVRENEPGNGSRTFEIFGQKVPDMGSHRRLFTRWCQVVHPLFSSEEDLVEGRDVLELYPKAKIGEASQLLAMVPGNSIGLFRSGFLGYSLVGHVELPQRFRPSGSANGKDAPGLPIFACITIPPKLEGESRVRFYRRGVLMCGGSMELGLPGLQVEVCCEHLKTDFSGMAVVKDECFFQLEQVLRERALRLARDTVEHGGRAAQFLKPYLES